ncbi:hypothetical protein LWI28_016008 [Acer negundo]|uniref:Uncharacterized protein n=1 Tax=Acer negundo TaxID=4023 RepID=A0AAD5IFE9_ACENE|nr:hypothetical protein LWI28_016008 [Acer negundo]
MDSWKGYIVSEWTVGGWYEQLAIRHIEFKFSHRLEPFCSDQKAVSTADHDRLDGHAQCLSQAEEAKTPETREKEFDENSDLMSFCVSAASDSFSTVVVAADSLEQMLYLCFQVKRTELDGLANGFGHENEHRRKKEERRWKLLARSMFGRESEGKRGKTLIDFW